MVKSTLIAVLLAIVIICCQTEAKNDRFLPFGSDVGDLKVPAALDASSSPINLTHCPFTFLGKKETEVFVNTNGVLSFGEGFPDHTQRSFTTLHGKALVAPYWVDTDITNFGDIFYRTSTESADLDVVNAITRAVFSLDGFAAKYLIVATYDRVAAFGGPPSDSRTNSYQVVLATDGQTSIVIFYYGDVEWGQGSNIGFNSRDTHYFQLPVALTQATLDVETGSNVEVEGLYVFRVEEEVKEPNLNYLETSISLSKPQVFLGDYIVLTCSVSNPTLPPGSYTYSWTHPHDHTSLQTQQPALVLPGLRREDLGEYTCRVSSLNAAGTSQTNLHLTKAVLKGGGVPAQTVSCNPDINTDSLSRDVYQFLAAEFGVKPFGRVRTYPARSCDEIHHTHPDLGAGLYWISGDVGQDPVETYCDFL